MAEWFHCAAGPQTVTVPRVDVCVYTAAEDRYVSAQLLKDGVWEPRFLRIFEVGARTRQIYNRHSDYAIQPLKTHLRLKNASQNWASDPLSRIQSGAAGEKTPYSTLDRGGNRN